MHWLECSLLVITLFAVYGVNIAVQTEEINKTAEIPAIIDPKENKVNFEHADSGLLDPVPIGKPFPDSIVNLTENLVTGSQNLTDGWNLTDLTKLENSSLKGNQKRDVENATFNDITPFLLFPILPFLFPPRESKAPMLEKNEFPALKNDSKPEGNLGEVKPFIFFDFAVNIRRMPLKNGTEHSNSKLIGNQSINISKAEDLEQTSQKNRKRRNTNTKVNTLGFFDDSPFFPDSELEEFLPKPDLFFPDLPFHHKPFKKLSRRKRDQKKLDAKNDLKMFIDSFYEAFMRTKKEVERADPFLNTLKEAEQSFDEERKEQDDLFSPISEIHEKPTMKWRIQRNIKRLKNDRHNELTKTQESPMIIVDKVVKIGEFHVDDEHDKNKMKKKKKKKRDAKDSKNIYLTGDSHDEISPNEDGEIVPKNIVELLKQEENKRKKRNHYVHSSYANVQSKEIKVLPALNTSIFLVNANGTELMNQESEAQLHGANTSNKSAKRGNLLKVVDSLKNKIKMELQNTGVVDPFADRLQQRNTTHEKKKRSYDDLKKNVTELIEQFLAVVKEFDDTQLIEKLEVSERDDKGVFDWTEKETLQNLNTYFLRKEPRGKIRKKNAEIEKEFVELDKKERQVTDLNYLFLTVTLPTVLVFALVLLVCFFNLQINGKICNKLFRPRQIFLIEDENPSQFVYKNPTGNKKIQNF